jgi:hypothetical protein
VVLAVLFYGVYVEVVVGLLEVGRGCRVRLLRADVVEGAPLEEDLAALYVYLLGHAVYHEAVLGPPVGGEVHRRLGVDGDEGGVAAGDQELVVVPGEAFAGLEPRYLLVGVVEDHVLPVAEAAVYALPPRKYGLPR